MSGPERWILQEVADGVGRITLNRPDRLNAFAGDMRERLAEAVEEFAGDTAVRVVVITGAGRAFGAGADVEAMAELLRSGNAQRFRELVRAGMRVVRAVAVAPKPVVAAVNGVAVGAAASLAAACDVRIASDRARVGFTFNRIGLHPDWGATLTLPRLVGAGRAAELILSARLLAADEAREIGLVQEVVEEASFGARVAELASSLAAKPPLALAWAKRTTGINPAALEEALAREEEAQLACFRSRDAREGITAFLEKREPLFQGE